MGSQTRQISLPVVDFSKTGIKPGNKEWDLMKSQVRKALEEFGSFEALLNVPVELQGSFFREVKELFDLDHLSSTKPSNVSNRPFAGYVGKLPSSPIHESFAIDDPFNSDNVEAVTNTLWPQGKPSFSNAVQEFSKILLDLETIIRRMVLESFDLEKYLDEQVMNSLDYRVRVIKYDRPQSGKAELGLRVHKDYHLLTILHQNEVNGLEIQTKDGEWIRPNLSHTCFIVIVGESFHAWTNGRVHSPYHRVMMTVNKIRYTVALFSSFRPGYIIRSLEELVDEEHPLLFKPFDFGDYFQFVLTSFRKGTDALLRDFCGV